MKNKSNNIIVFTYNMLYINDLIYNHIINIEKKFKSHNHVETLKIYNGLLKNIEEYYNIIKNIQDKINHLEDKLLHVDDEPILPEDILMTDEYLNTICFNEDYLKAL